MFLPGFMLRKHFNINIYVCKTLHFLQNTASVCRVSQTLPNWTCPATTAYSFSIVARYGAACSRAPRYARQQVSFSVQFHHSLLECDVPSPLHWDLSWGYWIWGPPQEQSKISSRQCWQQRREVNRLKPILKLRENPTWPNPQPQPPTPTGDELFLIQTMSNLHQTFRISS